MKKYDIIVIGSGISGLTCASLLSQIYDKKVLVLERHFKPGGFTHVFHRNGIEKYEWDVGLHYVGEMQEGSITRAIFDLISGKGVKWVEMPDPYDIFIFPDLVFKSFCGKENLKNALTKQFPAEIRGINTYFRDIEKAAVWLARHIAAKNIPGFPGFAAKILSLKNKRLALQTTGDYLNKTLEDNKLKAILSAQWGDCGLPPGLSAFAVHAVIARHYFAGGYYPDGGGKVIAESIIPGIQKTGGEVLVNNEVMNILVEHGKATGVRVVVKKKHETLEKEYRADVIVSAAGARTTFGEILPQEYRPAFYKDILNLSEGTSAVTLYAGLKADPRDLGLQGENYWIYSSYDHGKIYSEKNRILEGHIGACYVSFPSMKNPQAKSHTMELIVFADWNSFVNWADQPWKNRGQEYESLKKSISENMLEFVEKRLPGIKKNIDYMELSTPLSTAFFTGHFHGNIYGLPATPDRFEIAGLGAKTPIKNLYLTGSDTGIHGIAGALISGVLTTAAVLGSSAKLAGIFRRAMKYSRQDKN